VKQLEEFGFCIIAGVIPPEAVAAVRQAAAATAVEHDYIERDPGVLAGQSPPMEGWAAKGPSVVLGGGIAPHLADERLLAVLRGAMLGSGGGELSVFTTTAQVD
jgi:hypothetical protein